MSTDVSVDDNDAHRALCAGGLGGVLHEVGQDALHQVRASVGRRPRVEPQLSVSGGRAAATRSARSRAR